MHHCAPPTVPLRRLCGPECSVGLPTVESVRALHSVRHHALGNTSHSGVHPPSLHMTNTGDRTRPTMNSHAVVFTEPMRYSKVGLNISPFVMQGTTKELKCSNSSPEVAPMIGRILSQCKRQRIPSHLISSLIAHDTNMGWNPLKPHIKTLAAEFCTSRKEHRDPFCGDPTLQK